MRRIFFTLIELVCTISIIAILASLLLPSLKKAKDMARQTVCANNLKQVESIAAFYLNDYNGYALPSYTFHATGMTYWVAELFWAGYIPNLPYQGNRGTQFLVCPEEPIKPLNSTRSYGHYGISHNDNIRTAVGTDWTSITHPGRKIETFKKPSEVFLVMDQHFPSSVDSRIIVYNNFDDANGGVGFRHGNGANFLYIDGHVKCLKILQVPSRAYPNPPWCDVQ